MSKKLEEAIRYISNDEHEKAREIMHEFIVEKSRAIYEAIVNENDEDFEELGGDEKEDFIDDVEADMEDIDADELNDGEVDFEKSEEMDDEDLEDKVDDLESQIADLTAKFEELLQQEIEMEPHHDAEAFDMDDEDMDSEEDMDGMFDIEDEDEDLKEATEFSKKVEVNMNKEGEYAGTGAKSQKSAINTKSPYSVAQRKEKSPAGQGPVDFTKGGDEKGMKADGAKDHTPSTNVGEEPKAVSHKEQSNDSAYVGTGKGSKSGKVQSKSILSKKPE